MLRGVLAIRGQAAARGYGFIAVEGREDDVFVLGSEVTDEHGGPATRGGGEWSALDGRAVEICDVIATDRGDQATNVRLLPVENASTDGTEASTATATRGCRGMRRTRSHGRPGSARTLSVEAGRRASWRRGPR